MTLNGFLQLAVYFLLLLAITKPLGVFMARVFEGEKTLLSRLLGPLERLIYRVCRVDPEHEQRWTAYTAAMLMFSVVSLLVLYALQRLQHYLPLNPQQFAGVKPDLAFNTAVSFTTNTNWQAYSGESTMSYFVQMAGLAFHNFTSAATGIVLAIAFIRGIARREAKTIGNFWVDLTRCSLYVLLPLCLVGALLLISQGVAQNFKPYTSAALVEPQQLTKTDAGPGQETTETQTDQTIAQGPVASQEMIKELGTNGGGFFGANSAHPFESPTPLTNFFEMLAIFAIGSGLTYTLGRMTGNQRHGWAVFSAMTILFLGGFLVAYNFEARGNPNFDQYGVKQAAVETRGAEQAGGNMEGKEVRFGIANSALFTTITTDASCGAINTQHDSLTPLGGMIPLLNIMLGEIIFGGVGSGLYGMLVMVVLTVFIAGLMVGRTPEYLGKKIESKDVKMAMLYVLVFALSILCLSAWASIAPYGASKVNNGGPHGLSEIVYAYVSATGNNGSAFNGITVNNYWYNTTLGIAMLVGRFLMIIPMMAIAGNLAMKKIVPPSAGTFPVYTPLFVVLLIGVIAIVGALTFFPMLSLGPIVEHYLMRAGTMF
ncbi:MAG TPA: potassium-transporting ATPase subunit KdpA [Blastocatellia bacterium]|nr:potassium-transporting ATPase subunit KdpA [Blastocatellia bacterium]